jgi:hypothetical protein
MCCALTTQIALRRSLGFGFQRQRERQLLVPDFFIFIKLLIKITRGHYNYKKIKAYKNKSNFFNLDYYFSVS